jgi:hypothetical protein
LAPLIAALETRIDPTGQDLRPIIDNAMHAKGFSLLLVVVILTLTAGCDNVEWSGAEVALRPPPEVEVPQPPDAGEEGTERPLDPIRLGPLLYLVERTGADQARITPIAIRSDDGYEALPDPAGDPDFFERFPLERWEAGTEFVLFGQGERVGTFISDGTSMADESFCLPRATGQGVLELRGGLPPVDRFLALRRSDLDTVPSALGSHRFVEMNDDLRNASLDAARTLITRLSIPWPPTVLGIRERIDAYADAEGRLSVVASFVFGDELEVGVPEPTAYTLLVVTREDEDGEFVPVFSWYQREDSGGKAFPGFLAGHDVRGSGTPDLVLEVFGRDARGLAILDTTSEDWAMAYLDACAPAPASGALSTYF